MPTAAPFQALEGTAARLPFEPGPLPGKRKAAGGVLVTGFGPFQGHPENPSGELARDSGFENRIIEVSFRGLEMFFESIDPSQFESLVMLGAHGSSTGLLLELLAHNWNGKHPDVRGEAKPGAINPDAPAIRVGTLWQSLDLHELLESRPMRLSYHPGSYFCNRIYFEALSRFPQKRVGFLHLPRATSLALRSQKESLSRLLEQIVATQPGGDRSDGLLRRRLGFP